MSSIILINLYFYVNKFLHINLVKSGPVVSEKHVFLFSYVNSLGPRSRNDIELQYSHNFIISMSCLHLPTLRSQAAIASEKSTVFTFSYKKAYVSTFELAAK